MPFTRKPTISVIIPVHRGGSNFLKCLASLESLQTPPEEIIAVADGDTDGSWRAAEESEARILRIPVAGGPAKARNLGARSAGSDILFFVDADVTVPRDAIEIILRVFQEDHSLAAIFGSYDDEPSETNFLSQYKNLLHHHVHQKGLEEAFTFWGACGAIRRDVFRELGGFDETYKRPSIEDIELGYRLKRAGYRIRLLKSLQVKHLKHWGFISLLSSDFFDRALPWSELILSDRSLKNDLNLRYSERAGVALTYGLMVSLTAAVWWPGFLPGAGVLVISLLMLNSSLYGFFLRKRGLWFTLKAIPWHWFYYLYGGLAFAAAIVRHYFKRNQSEASSLVKDTEKYSDKERKGPC